MADKIRWVPEFIDDISGKLDKFEMGRRMGGRFFGNLYNPRSEFGKHVFIGQLAPHLGKPAVLILGCENICVPRPRDCAQSSKLKNVGF